MGYGQTEKRLALHLAIRASGRAATRGGAAARHYATREVVAGKDDLEVVRNERAHERVGIANLVLRLVSLHYGKVGGAAIGVAGGGLVLLPPGGGKLRLLLEGGAVLLLTLGVSIVITVAVGAVGLARLFVHTVNHALFGA